MTRKLLIASPAKGGLPLDRFVLHDILTKYPIPGWEIEWLCEGANSALNVSRDILANDAAAKGFDRIAMLDTDNPITREGLVRLLSHDHDEFQIVSGLYCIKRPGIPFWLGVKSRGAQMRADGLMEADFLPTGVLSISTDAIRTMQAKHKDREVYIQDDVLLPPGPRETKGTMFDLFPIGPQGPRTPQARMKRVRKAMEPIMGKGVAQATKPQMIEALQTIINALTDEGKPGYLTGEDYGFSWLARECGIKIWLDVRNCVMHTGSVNFPITDPAFVATSSHQIPEAEGDQHLW